MVPILVRIPNSPRPPKEFAPKCRQFKVHSRRQRTFEISVVIILMTLAPNLGRASPDRVVTTRFSGLSGGHSPSMAIYTKGGQGWEPLAHAVGDSSVFHQRSDGGGGCLHTVFETLAHQSQMFAMNKYVQTDFFSPEDVKKYVAESSRYMDRPVTYLHYVSETPTPDGLSGIISPEHQMRIGFDFSSNGSKDGYVRASLNLVAGQKVIPSADSIVPLAVPIELPWTTDPEFSTLAREHFDRRKYPVVWEIGRAARTDSSEFAELMGVAGNEMLRQTLHFGVPSPEMVEKGYVTFHTLTKTNTEKMEKLFPGKIFLRSKNDANNVVFLIPLKDYLAKSPVQNFNAAQRTLHQALPGKQTPVQAQTFIETLKYVQAAPLDFRYRGHFTGKPLLFSVKLSQTDGVPIDLLAQKFGITPTEIDRLRETRFLSQTGLIADPFWPGQVVDPATPMSIPQASVFRAFQIANLDPVLAAKEPGYAKAALVASFDHLFSLFGSKRPERHTPEVGLLANELRKNNLRFMITTHFESTTKVLRELGAEQSKEYPLNAEPHSKVYWDELQKHSGNERPSQKQSVFVFSIDQVLRFRDEAYKEAGASVSKLPTATPGVFWWLHGATAP